MREYKVTPQGFLEDFNQWNERFAQLVSSEWLGPKHWEVIRFLRNYYLTTNNIPTVYEVCQAHNLDLKDLQKLFPDGYRRGACRIAGLPFFP
jgi:tRNA 2-thiouridine synthesizing protein E